MAKRVLFSGSIAGHALGYGGNSWAFLQWLLGFRRLGFDVYYVEERKAGTCVDEHLKPVPLMDSVNGRYFRQVMERFDLGDRAALLEAGSSAHVGLSREDIGKVAGDVDLFLNQFGGYTAILGRVRRSVYFDSDPGHTQLWQEGYGVDMRLRGHDLYLTVGLNLGEPTAHSRPVEFAGKKRCGQSCCRNGKPTTARTCFHDGGELARLQLA